MTIGGTRSAIRPDAQAFDEVHIVTVPRYKTSGLSGSEWRISAAVKFMRKGNVVYEFSAGTVAAAVQMLGYHLLRAHDDGHAYYAGEPNVCDQEGCNAPPAVTYRVKQEFCNEPYRHAGSAPPDSSCIRKFCSRHSRRGDAAFDDADRNYELLEGVVASPHEDDVKPSLFGGFVDLPGSSE